MEAAGLALGAVALTSLFKDCIDLFSMITAARHLGQDAAILNTKLDVERMLLLQWSDRVDLLKHKKYDPLPDGPETHNTPKNPEAQQQLFNEEDDTPLRDPETRKIVFRVLKCIRSLLSEGTALQQTYGLQEVDSSKSSELNNSPTHGYQGASASRLARFLRDFERLNIDTQPKKDVARSSKISDTTKKIRWVIMHKDKFNNFIANLSYFNSSLMGLVPLSSTSDLSSCKEDLSRVRTFAELDMIIQASADVRPTVRDAAIAVKKAALQSQILQRLWFRYHDDRRVNVKDAHYKTLGWALDPPDGYMKWDDLTTWLQDTSSIYWVSGKAGSGKSTLMKYLLGHGRTLELLHTWACDSNLISASFFFYAMGRPEQKSQSGLLRSLLYQLLSHEPDSIEISLPHMWQEACTNTDRDPLNLSIPSVAEMKTALFNFCASCNARKKLFFMIDGLDEYEGDDLDAAEFITELGAFSNTKVLFSSRPHPAFVTLSSNRPKMNLTDLTKGDIASYINANVASHPYLVTLSEIQPNAAEELVEELVSKSSGVFLWVVLACRSVVEGCNDYCTFSDLQARVDELPREVEDLLQHMLNKIKPRWRKEAYKLLNLVYTTQRNDKVNRIPTFGLHLAYDQGFKVNADPGKANPDSDKIPGRQIKARCRIMEGLLRSRCCGLLEVQRQDECDSNADFCICGRNSGPHDYLQDSYVVFMHRTVYELLSQPRAWQCDFENFQDMTSDSYAITSTIWSQLVSVKRDQFHCIRNALAHIYYADKNGCPPEVVIHCLSRLQFICGKFELGYVWSTAKQHLLHNHGCPKCCDDASITLALAAEMGLTRAVRSAFEKPASLDGLLFRPTTINNKLLCECRSENPQSYTRVGDKSASLWQNGDIAQDVLQARWPMLYHAVCRPLLRDLYQHDQYPIYEEDLSPVNVVRYLLQLGYSPNEQFPRIDRGVSDTTTRTIWIQWIVLYMNSSLSSFNTPYYSKPDYENFTRERAETTKLLLDADAEIQELKRDILSRLLDHVDKFCYAADKMGDVTSEKSWIEIRDIISSRLRYTPSTEERSQQQKAKGVRPKNRADSDLQELAAAELFTESPAKRRKVIIDLTNIE